MSVQAIAWVLENSKAEGTDRLVLLAIANHCDSQGFNAWPATEQLGREARVSRASVFRSLSSLVGLGELERTSRPGRVSHYQLPLTRLSVTPLSGCDPSQVETPPVSPTQQTRLTRATHNRTNRQLTAPPRSPTSSAAALRPPPEEDPRELKPEHREAGERGVAAVRAALSNRRDSA